MRETSFIHNTPLEGGIVLDSLDFEELKKKNLWLMAIDDDEDEDWDDEDWEDEDWEDEDWEDEDWDDEDWEDEDWEDEDWEDEDWEDEDEEDDFDLECIREKAPHALDRRDSIDSLPHGGATICFPRLHLPPSRYCFLDFYRRRSHRLLRWIYCPYLPSKN